MHSVHTPSFPEILAALNASVIVSTYQAGKLILLRNENGTLNTHFRTFQQPMGVALQGGRLAVGTRHEIWEFHNTPAVASKLPSEPCRTDACYLPRSCYVTGDTAVCRFFSSDTTSKPGVTTGGGIDDFNCRLGLLWLEPGFVISRCCRFRKH
jgi:uncharacterized protein (TIGR03032 family)